MPDPLGSPPGESHLSRHAEEQKAAEAFSFHMPGHKGGAGAPPRGLELLGKATYAADLSEMGGFDYLHHPEGALDTAQQHAAALFGATKTWFLVNGATVGNVAALCATASDGDGVVIARASHRSVYAGLVVSGARPTYLPPVYNDDLDGLFGVDLGGLTEVLESANTWALHVTTPSYYGFTLSMKEISAITSAHDVALIVDEAHGTHFVAHGLFPDSALRDGADIAVQSPHKTLGSLTQSSLLHLQGKRVEVGRLGGWLQMLQSSSPSALLTVSLDLAIAEMANSGAVRWGETIELAQQVRELLLGVKGLHVYGDEVRHVAGIDDYDPTKLVVDVSELSITGFSAAKWLESHHHLRPEFSDLRRMVFSLTPADTEVSVKVLTGALVDLVDGDHDPTPMNAITSLWPKAIPDMVLTPREGTMRPSVEVPISKAAGRVVGEMVVPYPPGIPLLVPGEAISKEALEALSQLALAGSQVVGMADPTTKTIRCLEQ